MYTLLRGDADDPKNSSGAGLYPSKRRICCYVTSNDGNEHR